MEAHYDDDRSPEFPLAAVPLGCSQIRVYASRASDQSTRQHISKRVVLWDKQERLTRRLALRRKVQRGSVDDLLRRQAAIAKLVLNASALDVVVAIGLFAGSRLCGGGTTERWSPFFRSYQGELLRKVPLAPVT